MKTKIKEQIADSFAAVDERTDDYSAEIAERKYQLLDDVTERNPELWAAQGVDITITMSQLLDTPVGLRGDEWNDAFQSIIAVSDLQAQTEITVRNVLTAASKHAKQVESTRAQMKPDDLREASTEGVSKTQHKEAKERRKVKKVDEDV